jgi:hypothetical protein
MLMQIIKSWKQPDVLDCFCSFSRTPSHFAHRLCFALASQYS